MVAGDYFDELNKIASMGNYNLAPKLPAPVASNNVNPTYTVGGYGNPNSPATGASSGSDLDRLMSAIKGQESSGNYGAVNKDSGALGGYQIMPSNLPGWSQDALGRQVSQSEFMSNPSEQDSIARYELGKYMNQYGPAGAAVAWYGGPGAVSHMNDSSSQAGGYPSLKAYWEAILRRMG